MESRFGPDSRWASTKPHEPREEVEVENVEVDEIPDTHENAIGKSMQLPRFNLNHGITNGTSGQGNLGFLSPQEPHIIITRPQMVANVDTYGHHYGFPSDITTAIGSLKGFTKVAAIELDNIGCTRPEETMLVNELKKGVNIRTWDVVKPSVFTIYNTKSDSNVIGKELVELVHFNHISLKDHTSVLTPMFLLTGLDGAIDTMNYLYYPQFDRFYFIKNITSIREGLWAVNCEVDVIQSYMTQIYGQTAIIDRQEYNYNLYMNDGTLKAYSKPQQVIKKFPVNFNDLGRSFVIVGSGRAPVWED